MSEEVKIVDLSALIGSDKTAGDLYIVKTADIQSGDEFLSVLQAGDFVIGLRVTEDQKLKLQTHTRGILNKVGEDGNFVEETHLKDEGNPSITVCNLGTIDRTVSDNIGEVDCPVCKNKHDERQKAAETNEKNRP